MSLLWGKQPDSAWTISYIELFSHYILGVQVPSFVQRILKFNKYVILKIDNTHWHIIRTTIMVMYISHRLLWPLKFVTVINHRNKIKHRSTANISIYFFHHLDQISCWKMSTIGLDFYCLQHKYISFSLHHFLFVLFQDIHWKGNSNLHGEPFYSK